MAYNFSAVQRKSDGKYLLNNNTWGTLDFTANYTKARFYYSDADDVSTFVSSYPGGEYRVVEYWIPGTPGSNRPKSNATVLGNFMGSLYSANAVVGDSVSTANGIDRMRVQTDDDYNGFLADWNAAGGQNGFLLITTSDLETYRFSGVMPAVEVRGMPSDYTDDYWAIPIRSTNFDTRSAGYRRIVFLGVRSDVGYTGLEFKYVFV